MPDENVENTQETTSQKSALSQVRRELSEEELMQSGTIKMMLNQLDRYESEYSKFQQTLGDCHNVQTEREVLKHQLKVVESHNTFADILLALAVCRRGQFCQTSEVFEPDFATKSAG